MHGISFGLVSICFWAFPSDPGGHIDSMYGVVGDSAPLLTYGGIIVLSMEISVLRWTIKNRELHDPSLSYFPYNINILSWSLQ
jgi:hypothetical protein